MPKKIVDLTSANSVSGSTLIPVYNNSTTEKVTLSQIASYVGNVNTSGYATETYVNNAISNLVDGAPGALNTLNEIAAAISDDSSFAGTITASLALKANASDLGNITFNLQTITTSVTGGDVTVQAANHGAGDGGDVTLTAGTGTGNDGVVKINTAGIYTWIFDNGGNTTFPGDISFDSAVGDLTGSVIGDLRGSVFGDDSTIIVDGVNSKIKADVETTTDWTVDVEGETWTFDNLGGLTFPGGNNISTASGFRISPSNGSVLTLGTAAYEWRFDDSNGKLFLPIKDSTDTGDLELRGGGIYQIADEDLIIRARDADDDGFSVYLQVDDGAGSVLSETRLQRDKFTVNIDKGGANHNWSFDDTGWFELAGDIRTAYGVNTSIYLPGASDANTLTLKTVDNTDTVRSYIEVKNTQAKISSGEYAWTFSNTGILNIPSEIKTSGFTIDLSTYRGVDDAGLGDYTITIDGNNIRSDKDSIGLQTVNGYGIFIDESSKNVLLGDLSSGVEINLLFGSESITGEDWDAQLKMPNVGGTGVPSSFSITTQGDTNVWTFGGDGGLTIPGYIGSESTVDIVVNLSDSTEYVWRFTEGGELNIPGSITSNTNIIIDNRSSDNSGDVSVYADDDILIQAGDRTTPSNIEGGDINIYAGDGSPDDNINGAGGGGDIQISAGTGGLGGNVYGGSGGFVTIRSGTGGDGTATAPAGNGNEINLYAGSGGTDNGAGGGNGGDINISAGDTTDVAEDRGSIILTSGEGGDETTNGGYVEITIPSAGTNPGGSWIFTGAGNVLDVPADAEIFCPNNGSINVVTANNPTNIKVINTSTTTTHTWAFDDDGNLTIPGDIRSENDINIDINLSDSTQYTWTFTEGGDLTLPGSLRLSSGGIIKGNDSVQNSITIGASDTNSTTTMNGDVFFMDDAYFTKAVQEKFQELADATGTVNHDCSQGHIFYHASPDANWTVNLTNFTLTTNYATTITIIIDQASPGYYPNALQIGGSAQTINWQGNTTPTPSTNRHDVVTFSILAVSGGYIVLGQLTGF